MIFVTNLNPCYILPATQLSWHYEVAISETRSCVDEVWLILALQWWDRPKEVLEVLPTAMCPWQLLLCCKASPHRSHCPSPFLGFAVGSRVSCTCPKQKGNVQCCMGLGEGREWPFTHLVFRLDLVQVSIYYKQIEFFRCVGNSETLT